MPVRTLAAIGLFGVIVAVAVASAILVTRPPSVAVMTATPAALALGLVAGIALGAAGALAWALYREEPFGALATLCAAAWFAGWCGKPWRRVRGRLHGRPRPGFRLARRRVSRDPVAPPLARTRAGARPGRRGVRDLHRRPGVGAGPPRWHRRCLRGLPAQPRCRRGRAGRGAGGRDRGAALAAAWVAIVAVAAAHWLRASSPAGRRALLPTAVPGIVALLAFGLDAAWSVGRGVIGVDRVDEATWVVSAVALLGLASASVLRVVLARRTRSAVAQIVVDLAGGGPGSSLEHRLRVVIGDAGLRVAYPADRGIARGCRRQSVLHERLGGPSVHAAGPGRPCDRGPRHRRGARRRCRRAPGGPRRRGARARARATARALEGPAPAPADVAGEGRGGERFGATAAGAGPA